MPMCFTFFICKMKKGVWPPPPCPHHSVSVRIIGTDTCTELATAGFAVRALKNCWVLGCEDLPRTLLLPFNNSFCMLSTLVPHFLGSHYNSRRYVYVKILNWIFNYINLSKGRSQNSFTLRYSENSNYNRRPSYQGWSPTTLAFCSQVCTQHSPAFIQTPFSLSLFTVHAFLLLTNLLNEYYIKGT